MNNYKPEAGIPKSGLHGVATFNKNNEESQSSSTSDQAHVFHIVKSLMSRTTSNYTPDWNSNGTNNRFRFDTGATIHVCPWCFGHPFPSSGGKHIQQQWEQIAPQWPCIAFVHFRVHKCYHTKRLQVEQPSPYAMFRHRSSMSDKSLSDDMPAHYPASKMELKLDKICEIPHSQERHHFDLRTVPLGCHSISMMSYQASPLRMKSPSYTRTTMRKVSGGNTGKYWTDKTYSTNSHI